MLGDNASRELARLAPAGLPKEQLVPGAIVTVSSCKATGDRSFTDGLWEIVSTNAGHALIRSVSYPSEQLRTIQIHEREFYPAEHMRDVVRPV